MAQRESILNHRVWFSKHATFNGRLAARPWRWLLDAWNRFRSLLRNVCIAKGAINAIVWADRALQWIAWKKICGRMTVEIDLSSKHRPWEKNEARQRQVKQGRLHDFTSIKMLLCARGGYASLCPVCQRATFSSTRKSHIAIQNHSCSIIGAGSDA